MLNTENKSNLTAPDNCPHCGSRLSPWQKVLLGVDRILVCKNCWYRIILDISNPDPNQENDTEVNSKKRKN